MQIQGLQKLTLLDFPGHTACTVFLAGCNFRCPFCHNVPLVTEIHPEEAISEDTFFSFLKKRCGTLDGVCITGGEPLLYPDIEAFIRKIKALGFLVKLDTNGSFPERLGALLEAKLADYVAMDIKNCPEKYELTAGCKVDLPAIQKSISLLMESGTDYEFRTTVATPLHTEADIEKIAEWIRGAKRYYLQNFVDSGNLIGEGLASPGEENMIRMRDRALHLVPNVELRGI